MSVSPIPRLAHFVFGFREQSEPFHLLHYLAIESCRRLIEPEQIFLHYRNLPYGPYWELARPHLTLVTVDEIDAVAEATYDERLVPAEFRYAHHADFVRLDALLTYGGIYADIDTLFLRPFPAELFDADFVIGRESDVRDEVTGERRPSLCNALLLARPDAEFARVWRARMAVALNGTWSNHSGFLAQQLSIELPEQVRSEPPASFFPVGSEPDELARLFGADEVDVSASYSLHWWSHLWWSRERRDFSSTYGDQFTPDYITTVDTAFNRLARPFVPEVTWF